MISPLSKISTYRIIAFKRKKVNIILDIFGQTQHKLGHHLDNDCLTQSNPLLNIDVNLEGLYY